MDNISNLASHLNGKSICIDDVVSTYAPSLASHKSSWTHLVNNKLKQHGIDADVLTIKDNVHDYDVWFIVLPMEFQRDKGVWNLFKGADNATARRIQRLTDFEGEIYILDDQLPDVANFVMSRMHNGEPEWQALDVDKLTWLHTQVKSYSTLLPSTHHILGDSHSISIYAPGTNITRIDGKTLHGALKTGIQNMIPDNTTELTVYFGNIDIRFHLMRQEDPYIALKQLVDEYIAQLIDLNIKVNIVNALPIEHEGRVLPKSGWYKNKPFYGTQKERAYLVQMFNSKIKQACTHNENLTNIVWPEHWYTISPIDYAESYMEKPRSVHLSREYYQYDFITSKQNPSLISRTTKLF